MHASASLMAQRVKSPPAVEETPVKSWVGKICWKGIDYPLQYSWASLVVQLIKNPPAMQETWVQSLGWEEPLENGMATHSSILGWRIPVDRGAWWATVHGVAKSQTGLSN